MAILKISFFHESFQSVVVTIKFHTCSSVRPDKVNVSENINSSSLTEIITILIVTRENNPQTLVECIRFETTEIILMISRKFVIQGVYIAATGNTSKWVHRDSI